MTGRDALRWAAATSEDGTVISYATVGSGPSLIVLGGVLSDAIAYLRLAELLSDDFTVHLVNRRGRPGSGAMDEAHGLDEECADVAAVAAATDAVAIFGHSFGGLVALESARRLHRFSHACVYEPGVPLRGQLDLSWLAGYADRLDAGDRRGAFAWMVKHNGFAPPALAAMPIWCIKAILRTMMRGRRWAEMDALLEANLVEHRIEQALDSPRPDRFATIAAQTLLLGGDKSPPFISGDLIHELAAVIPNSVAKLLRGADHLAPQHRPEQIAAVMRASLAVTSTPPAA